MSAGPVTFQPTYVLAARAPGYRTSVPLHPDQPVRAVSEATEVLVTPGRVTLTDARHEDSGHAYRVVRAPRPRLVCAPGDPSLADALPAAVVAAIDALVARPDAFGPEALRDQLTGRVGDEPDEVSPDQADVLELADPHDTEGRLPYLTLRVRATGLSIVWDHGWRWLAGGRARQLEAVADPAAAAQVEASFGAAALALALQLQQALAER